MYMYIKVADLTSKLGEAAIATLPVGGTATLSAVDADGKGAEIDLARLDGAAAIRGNHLSNTKYLSDADVLQKLRIRWQIMVILDAITSA